MERDPYVALARAAIEAHVREGRVISPPAGLPPKLRGQAGAFVSLKRQGRLRGCIGTYHPSEPTLAEEVIQNAIRAATADPRFPPVTPEELPELSISVDVLSAPEPCTEEDLDPRRYGVIVEQGWRRGLLLPDLEGVNTVEEQLGIAKLKAGVSPHAPCRLFRFQVERHTE